MDIHSVNADMIISWNETHVWYNYKEEVAFPDGGAKFRVWVSMANAIIILRTILGLAVTINITNCYADINFVEFSIW